MEAPPPLSEQDMRDTDERWLTRRIRANGSILETEGKERGHFVLFLFFFQLAVHRRLRGCVWRQQWPLPPPGCDCNSRCLQLSPVCTGKAKTHTPKTQATCFHSLWSVRHLKQCLWKTNFSPVSHPRCSFVLKFRSVQFSSAELGPEETK